MNQPTLPLSLSGQSPLDCLGRCRTPDELIAAMAEAPALRDPARIPELREHARQLARANPPRAEHLEKVATEMAAILACLDAAPAEQSLAPYNRWIAEHGHGQFPGLARLALQCCRDSRARGEHDRRRRLLGMLLMRRTLQRFNDALGAMSPEQRIDAVFAETIAPVADYLAWLRLRGRCRDQGAEHASRLGELLAVAQRARSIQVSRPDTRGKVRITVPSTEATAELWFAQDLQFYQACVRDLQHASPAQWPSRLARLKVARHRRFVLPEHDASTSLHAAATEVHLTAVICEAALREGPAELTEPALLTYQDIVTSNACAQLPLPMRETFQYNYVYAVVRMWRRLREPLALLEQAVALGERVIAGADVVRPRLLRDLHFACARLCERLGAWEHSRFEAACEHYRRGLDIRGNGVEAERGPRGRALFDLANTLHHSGLGTLAEAQALFREAVQLLPMCEPGRSGAAVRLNYAIFLFERIGTTEAKARALVLLDEAEQVFTSLAAELTTAPSEIEIIASIWMTRGNIRREDDTDEAIRDALRHYERATQLLVDDPWLRPIRVHLALNRCFAHLDLGSTHDLEAALVAAREAAGHAIDASSLADAQLCEALVRLRTGEPPDQLVGTVERCFAVSRSAGGLIRSLSTMAWLARIRLAGAEIDDLEEARRLFRTGQDMARQANLVSEQLAHARGFADASVALWSRRSDPTLLSEAVAALEAVAGTLETALDADVLLIDGDNAHAQLAAVAADLTWLRATLDQPVETVLRSATMAKGPDINAELLLNVAIASLPHGDVSDLLRARQADWKIRRAALQRGKIDPTLAADVATLRASAEQRAWTVGAYRATLPDRAFELAQLRPERGVIVDITISRWGSVVTAIPSADTEAVTIHRAPFRISTLEDLLERWSGHVTQRRVPISPSLHRDIDLPLGHRTDATETMLELIRRDLLCNVLPAIGGVDRVVWIPHLLAGMPLHAIRMPSGHRLLETTCCLGYAANVLSVPFHPVEPAWRDARVLCLAMDPGGDRQLLDTHREVADVARRLLDAGAAVTVVSATGSVSGQLDFASRGLVLDPRATCEALSSITEWLTANLQRFDHIMVASHGTYGHTGGALVLPSSTMTIADLLATSALARRSTVHLSACETAVRTGAMYSLAGGLLQLGASVVIGTLWAVADRDARHSSDVLYEALVRGEPWEVALATAVRALRDEVGDKHIERWAPFVAMLC